MLKKITLTGLMLLISAGLGFALLPPLSQLSIHGSNGATYRLNKDGNEFFDDRLELNLSMNPFTIGVVALIYEPRLNPFSGMAEYRTDLSQIFVKYNTKPVKVTVGSFKSTLGKGLILRTYEEPDVDIDCITKGAYLELKPFKDLEVKALGGRGEASGAGNQDTLYGGEVTIYPLSALNFNNLSFNASVSSITLPDFFTLQTEDVRRYGFGGNLNWNFITASGVYAKKTDFSYADDPIWSSNRFGKGYYLSVVATPPFGRLSVSIEYKHYLQLNELMRGQYMSPPYVSFFEQSLNNGENELGYLIEVNSYPFEKLHLRGGYAHQEEISYATLEPRKIDEAVAVIRLVELLPHTDMELSYEREHEVKVTEKDRGKLKASYLLTKTHSVTASIEYEKRKEYLPSVDTYRDITGELSYSWSGHLIALLRHEFTNQEPESGERDKWTWGEITYKLTNEHELTVGYGQLRGGKVCASGVCRIELPFEGLRIKFSSLF
jgi:hypothetical protein